MNPESKIKADILKELGCRKDIVLWNNPVGTAKHTDEDGNTNVVRYGTGGEGAPDLLAEVLVGGVWACVWLEVKTPTGRLRPKQAQWHSSANFRGRHVFVVRSKAEALAAVAAVQSLAKGRMP